MSQELPADFTEIPPPPPPPSSSQKNPPLSTVSPHMPGMDYFSAGRMYQGPQSLFNPMGMMPYLGPPIVPAQIGGGEIVPAELEASQPKPSKCTTAPSGTNVSSTVTDQDLIRPCKHNTWTKEGKKRGRLVLRCMQADCRALWKTRPEAHQKCDEFYAGTCPFGGDCPHPHIYSNLRRPHLKNIGQKPSCEDDAGGNADEQKQTAIDDTGSVEVDSGKMPNEETPNEPNIQPQPQKVPKVPPGPRSESAQKLAEACSGARSESAPPWRQPEFLPQSGPYMYPSQSATMMPIPPQSNAMNCYYPGYQCAPMPFQYPQPSVGVHPTFIPQPSMELPPQLPPPTPLLVSSTMGPVLLFPDGTWHFQNQPQAEVAPESMFPDRSPTVVEVNSDFPQECDGKSSDPAQDQPPSEPLQSQDEPLQSQVQILTTEYDPEYEVEYSNNSSPRESERGSSDEAQPGSDTTESHTKSDESPVTTESPPDSGDSVEPVWI